MDQGTIQAIGIAAVIIFLAVSAISPIARNVIANKAQNQFMAGDFEGLLKTLSSPMAGIALPKFNQEFMRLNAYEASQNVEGVQQTLDRLLKLPASAEQRRILLSRALNFYEGQNDEDRATHVLELVDALPDQCKGEAVDLAKELRRDSHQTFDIVFRGSYSHIAEMEHALASAEGDERARLNYYLSLQYANKGDEKRADEYLGRIAKAYGFERPAAADEDEAGAAEGDAAEGDDADSAKTGDAE